MTSKDACCLVLGARTECLSLEPSNQPNTYHGTLSLEQVILRRKTSKIRSIYLSLKVVNIYSHSVGVVTVGLFQTDRVVVLAPVAELDDGDGGHRKFLLQSRSSRCEQHLYTRRI